MQNNFSLDKSFSLVSESRRKCLIDYFYEYQINFNIKNINGKVWIILKDKYPEDFFKNMF